MTLKAFLLYLPFANPVLIFAGWWFIRKNAKIFAARTEANSIAKDIQQITNDIGDISKEYWLSDKFENKYSYEIIILAALDRLKTKIEVFKNYGIIINNTAFIKYRRTLTLDGRSESSTQESRNKSFSNILKQTTLLNNHIDELISRTNIDSSQSFYKNFALLLGIFVGVILSFFYLLIFVVS